MLSLEFEDKAGRFDHPPSGSKDPKVDKAADSNPEIPANQGAVGPGKDNQLPEDKGKGSLPATKKETKKQKAARIKKEKAAAKKSGK